MNPNSGDRVVATILNNVGNSKNLLLVKILLSKIRVMARGIIGVRAKPRRLHRILRPRGVEFPLPVNMVPASDRITSTVRIMAITKGFLRETFNAVLEYNNPSK